MDIGWRRVVDDCSGVINFVFFVPGISTGYPKSFELVRLRIGQSFEQRLELRTIRPKVWRKIGSSKESTEQPCERALRETGAALARNERGALCRSRRRVAPRRAETARNRPQSRRSQHQATLQAVRTTHRKPKRQETTTQALEKTTLHRRGQSRTPKARRRT